MATLGLVASVTDRILSLPGWLVLALVFAFPALEASAFVGFVFPGEIAVILGESRLRVERSPLWAVIAAAVAGAIIGDSIGYLVGRRWGTHLLHGTLGRLPVISTHLDKHVDSARAYVRRRKGSAVFFGRFTAVLRVLVPGRHIGGALPDLPGLQRRRRRAVGDGVRGARLRGGGELPPCGADRSPGGAGPARPHRGRPDRLQAPAALLRGSRTGSMSVPGPDFRSCGRFAN